MKRLLLFSTLFIGLQTTFAQHCPLASGSYICNDFSQPTPGFSDMNSIPCIVKGQPVDFVVKFRVPPQWPQPVTQINSFRLVGMDNLPCGLCWTTNKPNDFFLADEAGCIRITGVTNDPAGLYKAQITADANIGNPPSDVNGVPIAQYDNILPGFKFYLRVVNSANDPCPAVDFNSQGQVAGNNCPLIDPVSVQDPENTLTQVSIYPNPAALSANLRFVSENSQELTMVITDLQGKQVFQQLVSVNQGDNNVLISTSNLATGIYMVQLQNEKIRLTTKISVQH